MTDQNKNQNQNQKGYKEAAGEFYNRQYESWMPWIEDKYLSWFTKDNKASYATKQELDKTKITGNEQVDNLQDGVNNLVGGQLGKGGLAQPVGDAFSKEGVNRMERGGKEEDGSYGGPLGGYGQAAADGAKGAGEGIAGGVKSVGGLLGGGKGESK
ncbi:hypothetical protein PMIN06_011872 [Paraphaeosphaeria minitans]|uniref:Uncharacterized protein n=1 Tax=Paraphaeosphaeria minitans TaxID=565426 RepID=A0A9P6GVA2_9PLEO|nr:hypothetical protein PMIN01_01274 [Paraphaeosphaeria minitans]